MKNIIAIIVIGIVFSSCTTNIRERVVLTGTGEHITVIDTYQLNSPKFANDTLVIKRMASNGLGIRDIIYGSYVGELPEDFKYTADNGKDYSFTFYKGIFLNQK
jgi:hypothetical protein|tara:strand:- start:1431 stop:1742 length:312 start_codon:yes stop_codon:yes gene_type:complete